MSSSSRDRVSRSTIGCRRSSRSDGPQRLCGDAPAPFGKARGRDHPAPDHRASDHRRRRYARRSRATAARCRSSGTDSRCCGLLPAAVLAYIEREPPLSPSPRMRLNKLQKTAVTALDDIKARDITVLDVRKLTSLFDAMIIATRRIELGRSKALARHVRDKLDGDRRSRSSASKARKPANGCWSMPETSVVHIMQPAVRALQPGRALGAARDEAPHQGRRPRRRLKRAAGSNADPSFRNEAARRRARPADAGVGRCRLGRIRAPHAAANSRSTLVALKAEPRDRGRTASADARVPKRCGSPQPARSASMVALDERGEHVDDARLADQLCAVARRGARRRVRDRQRRRLWRNRQAQCLPPSSAFRANICRTGSSASSLGRAALSSRQPRSRAIRTIASDRRRRRPSRRGGSSAS